MSRMPALPQTVVQQELERFLEEILPSFPEEAGATVKSELERRVNDGDINDGNGDFSLIIIQLDEATVEILDELKMKQKKKRQGIREQYKRDYEMTINTGFIDACFNARKRDIWDEGDLFLELWTIVGKPSPDENGNKMLFRNTGKILDSMVGHSRDDLITKVKHCKELEDVCKGLGHLSIDQESSSGHQEDLDFLREIKKKHPALLYAIANKEFTLVKADELLNTYGLDEFPGAVIEVLEGANKKAIAVKYGKWQF